MTQRLEVAVVVVFRLYYIMSLCVWFGNMFNPETSKKNRDRDNDSVLALHCRQTCLDKEASIQRHTVTSPLHHTNVRISGTVAIHHVVNNLVFVAECEKASKLDQMQWKMSLAACPCRQLAAYTIEM